MNYLEINRLGNSLGSPIMTLINYLTLTYFSEYYAVCIIKTSLDYILLSNPVPTVIITVGPNFNESFQSGIDSGCQAFVVYEKALSSFLDLFVITHDASDQRSSRKKLITVMDSFNISALECIRDHPNILEIPDIVIICPDTTNRVVKLYTTHIFNNGSRGSVRVALHPVTPPDYFPDKFDNMNRNPIRLCTLMYPPYSYYEEVGPEKSNARYDRNFKEEDVPLFLDGTEPTLIVEFCRRRNCTIEASFDEENLWGEVYDNHTGIGLLGSVVERRADVAVAAIYYWRKPYDFATYTQPISRSGITVLVPKPRILPPWRTPFLSFTGSLWIAVLLAFIVGAVAVWLIEKVRYQILNPPSERPTTISDAVLTMIGFYMEQGARMRTDLTSCVFLFTSLLFAGFMVGNSYGGGLASIMTIPQYESSIDTVVDLADSGMAVAGTALSWIFSILFAPQPYLKVILKNYHVASEEFLISHTKTHDLGFFGERTEFSHFVPAEVVDHEASTMLQLLKDDVYWESVVAIVSKTCPFKQPFNDLIMQVKQSGIQNFWEMRSSNRYLDTTVQQNIWNARNAESDDNVVRLTISHFLGAYLILGAGLILAAFSFGLECVLRKLLRR